VSFVVNVIIFARSVKQAGAPIVKLLSSLASYVDV